MSDRWFFSLLAVAALAMIALALVYPQGLGRRSPPPFGHMTSVEAEALAKRQGRLPSAPPPAAGVKGPTAP